MAGRASEGSFFSSWRSHADLMSCIVLCVVWGWFVVTNGKCGKIFLTEKETFVDATRSNFHLSQANITSEPLKCKIWKTHRLVRQILYSAVEIGGLP